MGCHGDGRPEAVQYAAATDNKCYQEVQTIVRLNNRKRLEGNPLGRWNIIGPSLDVSDSGRWSGVAPERGSFYKYCICGTKGPQLELQLRATDLGVRGDL